MTDPNRPVDDDEAGPAGLGLLEPAAATSLRNVATEKDPKERKLPGRRARVTLAGPDGEPLEPFEVRVDNRDFLRWDKTAPRQKWGSGRDVPFLMATFLAWSAASRTEVTTLSWAQFEAAALEVEELAEEDSDLARPTR
jgi:hypothetical protein